MSSSETLTHKPVHPLNPLLPSERSEEGNRGELKMTNQTKTRRKCGTSSEEKNL
jgi:hypothetical protein